MNSIENWIHSVLSRLRALNFPDFSGVGLVFYTDRNSLPVCPLTSNRDLPLLSCREVEDAANMIAQISRRRSNWHDGFHLVDAYSLFLTDICQFLAPPIPSTALLTTHEGGARNMAARLTSLLPTVSLTMVCTTYSQATIFERGNHRFMPIGENRIEEHL